LYVNQDNSILRKRTTTAYVERVANVFGAAELLRRSRPMWWKTWPLWSIVSL